MQTIYFWFYFLYNRKFTLTYPINLHKKKDTSIPCVSPCVMSAFFKKTQAVYLQFFLTFFWQNKIAKEMWGNVKCGIRKARSGFTAFSYTLLYNPRQFVLYSDFACFRVWFCPYQGVILCVSGHETGYITCWNGAFRMMKKSLPNVNYWYSVDCVRCSFFAYLHPTESLCANIRLFFGVDQKTRTEKSRDTENL